MRTVMDANISGARIRMILGHAFTQLFRNLPAAAEQELRRAVESGAGKAALIVKKELETRYREGTPGHKALHPFTIARKGHARTLFDTGGLSRAVVIFTRRRGRNQIEFSIGIPKGTLAGAKARMAEDGTIIKVTDKMRRFLAWQGLIVKKKFLRVPARPVLQEVKKRSLPKVDAKVRSHLQVQFIGRKFGRIL